MQVSKNNSTGEICLILMPTEAEMLFTAVQSFGPGGSTSARRRFIRQMKSVEEDCGVINMYDERRDRESRWILTNYPRMSFGSGIEP